jgi:hypothetical protein
VSHRRQAETQQSIVSEPRRIGLCPCDLGYGREGGSARGQMQKGTAGRHSETERPCGRELPVSGVPPSRGEGPSGMAPKDPEPLLVQIPSLEHADGDDDDDKHNRENEHEHAARLLDRAALPYGCRSMPSAMPSHRHLEHGHFSTQRATRHVPLPRRCRLSPWSTARHRPIGPPVRVIPFSFGIRRFAPIATK